MDRHHELDAKALLQRRRAIDALDAELLRLLNQRARSLPKSAGSRSRAACRSTTDVVNARYWSAFARRTEVRWKQKVF